MPFESLAQTSGELLDVAPGRRDCAGEDVPKETVGTDAVAPREIGFPPDLDLDHVSRTDPVAGDPILPESGPGQNGDRRAKGADDPE